jgi:hypothetical protein
LRALLSTLPPDVLPDPSLPVIPVTPPPELQPGAGVSGVAFLITYAPTPPPVRAIAVKAVLVSEANQAAIDGIREPDPTLDTDAGAFAALGEGDLDGLDVDGLLAQLDAFRATNELGGVKVGVEVLLWTHDSLNDEDHKTMLDLTGQVQQALGSHPDVSPLTKGDPLRVGYTRTGTEPVAFLFLIVSSPAV